MTFQSIPSASRPAAAFMAFVATALFWVPTLTAPQEAHAAAAGDGVVVTAVDGQARIVVSYAPAPVLM